VVRADFVGFLSGEGCSTLDPIIMFLSPMITFISLGGVFGRIRLRSGFLCLIGCLREDPHHEQYKETTYYHG
jgi:hypothetical protein